MANPLQFSRDPALNQKLRELRRVDNYTNFFYIARIYVILSLTIGGTIYFYHLRQEAGLSFWWNVALTVLAIFIIGASQHQLAGATHEATHQILFKNRILNEVVSDWLCSYPLFSSTHQFRLHHLVHHHFVNDPVRDPDFSQLKMSGHWLKFPVSKGKFLTQLLKQLWLLNLLRYIWVRARYDSLGLLPDRHLLRGRFKPVISTRLAILMRVSFLIILFTLLRGLRYWTGVSVGLYFLVLWIVPLVTTFSFFMILRQLVQHGNGGRGWLNNTRVFLINPLLCYAVFPFGMDYHLPHHMFATVPHYRLSELHQFLLRYPEYAAGGVVVRNYFFAGRHLPAPRSPTVLEVIGAEYSVEPNLCRPDKLG